MCDLTRRGSSPWAVTYSIGRDHPPDQDGCLRDVQLRV